MMLWTVNALLSSALLIALVMVLRRPIAQAFGARAAYALWALPALRFVMPALPGWRALYVPFLQVGPHDFGVGLTSPADALRMAAENAPPPVPPVGPPPVPPLFDAVHVATVATTLWLVGAALWLGWSLLSYQLFLRRALRGASLLTTECGTDVLLTGAVDGPVAAGIVHRRIFLPLDFMTRYGADERRLALLHEGAHHDRRDILANLAALIVLALHWWNPLAHRAYRMFRADQELACDETVLAELRADQRHAYGSAVVKAATTRMPGVACALGHRAELKQRLRSMARPMPGKARTRAGLGLAALAVGTGLLLTAPGRTAPPPDDALSAADRAEIRADAEEARREGEQARREAATAREEAARDREEGAREREQAQREAALDRAQAAREAEQGRREAAIGRAEAMRASYTSGEGARQVAAVRHSMAAKCASEGKPVSEDLDWERLALCGDTGASISARVQAQVHAELARQGID